MKIKKHIILPILLITIALTIIIIGNLIDRNAPVIIQGVVQCRQYKAASKIPGRIDSLNITEGQYVNYGELLYTLSTPELDTKLTQASAAKSAAIAMDQQALAGARQQQIEAARNLWQKATAGRDLAEKSYNRAEKLFEKGVITAQQLDEAQANFESMKATQSAAYAQYSLALAGATKEQKAAAAANVDMAQGVVNEVQTYISDSKVYSPIAGEISTIAYNKGELVAAGYPVVTILDLNDIWVEFNIKESLMPHIDVGKEFRAYFPALDQYINLTVSYIAKQADFAIWNDTRANGGFDIRTFTIRLKPLENKTKLLPGMSAIIKF